MRLFNNIAEFWQMTWKRSVILIMLCSLILLRLINWQVALGVIFGGLVLLGDIYLLKAPLDTLLERAKNKKRPWIMALNLFRIIVLGAFLLVIVKFHIANIIGVFIGATIPMVSIVSLLVFGGLSQWKV
jgi:hypothetical protein